MARLRFRTRLPAPDFRPGYTSRFFGALTRPHFLGRPPPVETFFLAWLFAGWGFFFC